MNISAQHESPGGKVESPFHRGEQEIQSRLGVRDQMEKFGGKVIRDFMPGQHRNFYSHLPFLIMGHCDKDGWLWASIVTAPPGFVSSPDDKHLNIHARPLSGDPLAESLKSGLAVGVLGIEPRTRRRNRLSTVVEAVSSKTGEDCFQLKVKQSFGNCPQYIQARQSEAIAAENLVDRAVVPFETLSDEAVELIRQSDTFYVASSTGINNSGEKASHGTDASHRGGMPGFVEVDEAGVLTIPDYLGNNHFNTLGNFQLYPKAGLLFIDDQSKDILMLTGSAEIVWDHEMQPHFEGAQRFWRFRLDHGVWLKKSLPLATTFEGFSPNTLLTGDWKTAKTMKEADSLKAQWQACRLSKKVTESNSVCSFYFRPEAGVIPHFKAGQYITLQLMIDHKPVVRSYTVSRAPGSSEYRISVKRDTDGQVSRYLHDTLEVGQRVLIKAPRGQFTFDTTATRPAVMLIAGIGITPVISMLHDVIDDKVKRRHIRTVLVIATARSDKERAFSRELAALAKQSDGSIQVLWVMTSPEEHLTLGDDYHHKGRVNRALLQNVLPLDDYDFYLCGPDGFMQSTYDMLQGLGVMDRKIMAESFGPSALERRLEGVEKSSLGQKAAAQALVTIRNPQGEILTEQHWTDKNGSLLEFAEAHGINPEFGCRRGNCGSCAVKIHEGNVIYQQELTAPMSDNTVLLCCAKPAFDEEREIPTIDIQLSD